MYDIGLCTPSPFPPERSSRTLWTLFVDPTFYEAPALVILSGRYCAASVSLLVPDYFKACCEATVFAASCWATARVCCREVSSNSSSSYASSSADDSFCPFYSALSSAISCPYGTAWKTSPSAASLSRLVCCCV